MTRTNAVVAGIDAGGGVGTAPISRTSSGGISRGPRTHFGSSCTAGGVVQRAQANQANHAPTISQRPMRTTSHVLRFAPPGGFAKVESVGGISEFPKWT